MVTGAVVRNRETGASRELAVDGVFVAIGHTPNTGLFEGQIDLDANGYIVAGTGTRTSVPGVFACGTCRTTCTGRRSPRPAPAAWPAIDAERYLESL